jgi:hypothetical protein
MSTPKRERRFGFVLCQPLSRPEKVIMLARQDGNRNDEVHTVEKPGRLITLILTFTLLFPVFGRTESFEAGFGGIPWGESAEGLPGLQKVGAKEGVEYYANPGKQFTLDDVEIREVVYGFYEDRFFAAYLKIETLEVFQQLKQKIQSRYGAPLVRYAVDGQPAVYRWKEQDLKIKLKVDHAGRNMKLGLYYVPLTDKVNEQTQERFQEQRFRVLPIQPDRTPEMIPLLEF